MGTPHIVGYEIKYIHFLLFFDTIGSNYLNRGRQVSPMLWAAETNATPLSMPEKIYFHNEEFPRDTLSNGSRQGKIIFQQLSIMI